MRDVQARAAAAVPGRRVTQREKRDGRNTEIGWFEERIVELETAKKQTKAERRPERRQRQQSQW
jgi:hypothetical protein